MLSGSSRIRCGVYRDHLAAKLNRKLADLDREATRRGEGLTERVVGGEMEGVGLVAAPAAEGHTPWLIVKGISDFADEDHDRDADDEKRRKACENALALVLDALARAPLPDARGPVQDPGESSTEQAGEP